MPTPDAARVCPSCMATMEQTTLREVTLDRCATCGGIWFDNAELSDAAGGRVDVDMLDVDSPRKCPGCKGGMEKARVKGLEVETCSQCGGVFIEAAAKDGIAAVGAVLDKLR
jgi:Zn-finger nucleic acid-binding protein